MHVFTISGVLHSLLWVWVTCCCRFLSPQRTSFISTNDAVSVTVSSISFCASRNILILLPVLKDHFTGHKTVGWEFFLFAHWPCHSSIFWPPLFVMRNQLSVVSLFLSVWWVIFLWLLSRVYFYLWLLVVWLCCCPGVVFLLFILPRFDDLLGSLWYFFFNQIWDVFVQYFK